MKGNPGVGRACQFWFCDCNLQTFYGLKMTAKVIGAKPVRTLFTGLVSGKPHPELPASVRANAKAMARKLL
jgi:hypothetical protein